MSGLSPASLHRPPSHTSGLCFEKVPASSPSLSNQNTGSPSTNRNVPDREQEIINCYEKSGDIALLYLQEAEKVKPGCFSLLAMLRYQRVINNMRPAVPPDAR